MLVAFAMVVLAVREKTTDIKSRPETDIMLRKSHRKLLPSSGRAVKKSRFGESTMRAPALLDWWKMEARHGSGRPSSWTTTNNQQPTQSPLLFFWNDSDSPKYTGCLAITQGPFNRPYQNTNSDSRSNCNSHLTCREKHPGNSAAFCLRTDANRFCCKSIEFRAGKHYESGCLAECTDGDHAYCGHLSPGQKPAECYQGDHPFHRAFGSVGCCRAEYERTVTV